MAEGKEEGKGSKAGGKRIGGKCEGIGKERKRRGKGWTEEDKRKTKRERQICSLCASLQSEILDLSL